MNVVSSITITFKNHEVVKQNYIIFLLQLQHSASNSLIEVHVSFNCVIYSSETNFFHILYKNKLRLQGEVAFNSSRMSSNYQKWKLRIRSGQRRQFWGRCFTIMKCCLNMEVLIKLVQQIWFTFNTNPSHVQIMRCSFGWSASSWRWIHPCIEDKINPNISAPSVLCRSLVDHCGR